VKNEIIHADFYRHEGGYLVLLLCVACPGIWKEKPIQIQDSSSRSSDICLNIQGGLLERGCHDYTSIPGGKGIAWNNN
jgi:hypothetical protein